MPNFLPPTSSDHRSVSAMCKFCRCPRLYFWSKQCRLSRPSTIRDLAMNFGSGIHAGAPFTHPGTLNLPRAFDEFNTEWDLCEGDSYEDKKRNTQVAKRILASLVATHAAPAYPEVQEPEIKSYIRKGKTGPHEVTFDIDIGLPSGKPITGRIDALGRDSDGDYLPIEYKTASQLWRNFNELWAISPQVETYALALTMSGYKVSAGLVEGILVAAGKTDVSLVPIDITEQILDDCIKWWKWKDRQLVEFEGGHGALEYKNPSNPLNWPCERSACSPYPQYGLQGFVCEYQPLCLAGDRWEKLLGMYKQKPREGEGQ